MTPLEITLLILLATILAFVSGKIPFAVISSGIILALILTGVMTPAEAFGGFINTNVVMFVAMFVIGAGLTKTVLIDKAQSLVVRYKDNQRVLIFLSCAAAAFLGAITSATATAAIIIPLLVGIANDIGTSRSKLLYPAMACANIATQMTFMGQGRQQYGVERCYDESRCAQPAARLGFYRGAHSNAGNSDFVHDLCRLQAHA